MFDQLPTACGGVGEHHALQAERPGRVCARQSLREQDGDLRLPRFQTPTVHEYRGCGFVPGNGRGYGAAQQFEVAHLVADPLAALRNGERASGVRMTAQRAVERNKSVTDQPVRDLTILPAIPALTSSPCLYEERLLKQPALLIHSGHPGLLLEIQSDDFKQMLSKASAGHFGVLLSEIQPNLDRPADANLFRPALSSAFTGIATPCSQNGWLLWRAWLPRSSRPCCMPTAHILGHCRQP